MANNRLSAALAAAVLVVCFSVGAAAEAASSDSASEPVTSSAASEPVQQETASPSDLSDTALSADTRYSADEITEILKQHPNAFTTAADPAAESSGTTTEDTQTDDSTQQETNTADSGTIWLKPFVAYTPAEGYLLLLFIMAVSALAFKICRFVWL